MFLIPGLFKAKRTFVLWFLLLLAWSLLSPLYPARMVTYSIIPASLIASAGFLYLYKRFGTSLARALLLIILVLSLGFFLYDPGFTRTEITGQDLGALHWLRDNTAQDSVVASNWQVSGVWMPAVAERANVLGALQEAVPDFEERRADLHVIFAYSDTDTVRERLEKYGADYIYINSNEERILYQGAIERLGSMFTEVYVFGLV